MGKTVDFEEAREKLLEIPDEDLARLAFSMPWQSLAESYEGATDEDGFPLIADAGKKEDTTAVRKRLQQACFQKAHKNPHINTAVRGLAGRVTGMGFEITSGIPEIQEVIDEIILDPRNRLYYFLYKYYARHLIEGELFLCLTLHKDGFIEVDFVDPAVVSDSGGDGSGVIVHPSKPTMPLMYNIRYDSQNVQQIPSIFCGYYPELLAVAAESDLYRTKLQGKSKSRARIFSKFKGYNKFIIVLEKGFVTKRAISYLRTTLEWINHYENLKKYEIDHKKAAGAYLWIFTITEPKSFKLWLSMSDEDRRKTGIMAKKSPGSSLVLPPGMEVEVKNPVLSSIREQDTDILEMVGSGLNEPEDVLSSKSRSPYASIRASRGPMSDRVSDEVVLFDRWFKYDFWGFIFYAKSVLTEFPETFKVREAISFKSKKPQFKEIEKKPSQLINVSYPVSEVVDLEGRAKGMLGVKHGPLAETLGVPNSDVASKLGIGDYRKARLRKATEDEEYPELNYAVDAEKAQEDKLGGGGAQKKTTPKGGNNG
jgi:hypothetical protein